MPHVGRLVMLASAKAWGKKRVKRFELSTFSLGKALARLQKSPETPVIHAILQGAASFSILIAGHRLSAGNLGIPIVEPRATR